MSDTSDSGESLVSAFEYVESLAGLSRDTISDDEVVYSDGDERVVLKDWDGYDYCLVEYHIDGERVEDLPFDTVSDMKSEAEEFVSVMQEKY